MTGKLHASDSIIYKYKVAQTHFTIYWVILLIIILSISSLPFIKLDISVKSTGIIRPKDEKTELKSSISTTIDNIYFKEGDIVNNGDIIVYVNRCRK